MTLTGQGLVLGAGTMLAKLDDKAVPIEADQERIWTLLSIAYGDEISQAVFGSLRRVAKHWQGGDKQEPGLRWIDDDHVSVDLGEVTWLTPQFGQLGHVKISYKRISAIARARSLSWNSAFTTPGRCVAAEHLYRIASVAGSNHFSCCGGRARGPQAGRAPGVQY